MCSYTGITMPRDPSEGGTYGAPRLPNLSIGLVFHFHAYSGSGGVPILDFDPRFFLAQDVAY